MRKLEIGPAANGQTPDGDQASSWDTLDSSRDCTYQATWGESLPIESDTYDLVHASHVLEHVPWWKVETALREARRILAPGGRLEIFVPDGIKILREYLAYPTVYSKREQSWPCAGLNPGKDPWIYLNARLFWGARPGEMGQPQHFHKSLYGESILNKLLFDNNFADIQIIQRTKSGFVGHGWMEIGMQGVKT